MPVLTMQHKIRNSECDINSNMKASSVLNLFQDIAGAQCEQYGIDQSSIACKGLCWVIARQHAVFIRPPRFSETVTVETWPGKPILSIMPRYYRIIDGSGNVCVSGCAWWVLMDINTRAMVIPSKYGVDIPWEETGNETVMPKKLAITSASVEDSFTVPWSCCDINGHMNNVRYIDLCEDKLYKFTRAAQLSELSVEYSGEAHIEDKIKLKIGVDGNCYCVRGDTDKVVFKALLRYCDISKG